MISQNTGRTLYPLQLRRIHGERGHILKLSINSNIDPQNKRSGETGGQGTLLSTIFQALSPSLKFRQHSLSGRSNSVFYEISLRRRKKPFLGIPIYLTFNSITCSSKGFAEFLTSQPSQFTLNSLTLVWTHGNKTKQNKQPNKKLENKTKQNKTKKQTTTEKPKKNTPHTTLWWFGKTFPKNTIIPFQIEGWGAVSCKPDSYLFVPITEELNTSSLKTNPEPCLSIKTVPSRPYFGIKTWRAFFRTNNTNASSSCMALFWKNSCEEYKSRIGRLDKSCSEKTH